MDCPAADLNLARQTVEQFIGVPVQYYGVIDFGAFIKLVDEIGGVQVKPDEPVTIEKFGGGQEQVLEAGKSYTLDGELAFGLCARTPYFGGRRGPRQTPTSSDPGYSPPHPEI